MLPYILCYCSENNTNDRIMVDKILNISSSHCVTVYTTCYYFGFIVVISRLNSSVSAHYEKQSMF